MRMRVRSWVRAIALIGVMAVAAAACSKSSSGGPTPSGGATTQAPTQGGSLVLGAEQWPQCLNPITSCSFASWYFYTTEVYVLPRLLAYDLKGNPIPSLATEVPSVDNGQLVQSPFS